MKAPITGNSITERVQYTGLYVPEEREQREAEAAERDGHDAREAHAADGSQVAAAY